jgi:hypothetical protein
MAQDRDKWRVQRGSALSGLVKPGELLTCWGTVSFLTRIFSHWISPRGVIRTKISLVVILSRCLFVRTTCRIETSIILYRCHHAYSQIFFSLNFVKYPPFRCIFQLKYLDQLHSNFGGTRWRSWLRHCATSRKVRFPIVSLDFFIDIILPAALWPWGRLSL